MKNYTYHVPGWTQEEIEAYVAETPDYGWGEEEMEALAHTLSYYGEYMTSYMLEDFDIDGTIEEEKYLLTVKKKYRHPWEQNDEEIKERIRCLEICKRMY